jgi:hypothetical protein
MAVDWYTNKHTVEKGDHGSSFEYQCGPFLRSLKMLRGPMRCLKEFQDEMVLSTITKPLISGAGRLAFTVQRRPQEI